MLPQACDRCHRRKTRCDRRLPRCSACERANVPCLHTNKFNLLPYPRAHINSLETSLRRAESEKERLANEVAVLRESLQRSTASEPPRRARPESGSSPPGMVQADARGAGGHDGSQELPQKLQRQSPRSSSPAPEQSTQEAAGGRGGGGPRASFPGSGMTLAGVVYSLIEPPEGTTHSQGSEAADHARVVLPVRETAMKSIEAYFNHWHLTFPLVCRPQFLHIVDQIYADEQHYHKNAFDAFLFDMVLGMGAMNMNKPDWVALSPESHYMRAIARLEHVFAMKGIAPLQALLLVCQYHTLCSLKDTSTSVWHLVGIAARLCIEMGLHRKSRVDDSTAQGIDAGLVRLDIEARRRTFWCFYNLDRIISVTLGRPVALRDEDIDIPLPTALNTDNCSLEDLTNGFTISCLRYTSPFLHLIGIRRIAGKIIQRVHCATLPDRVPMEEKLAVKRELQGELAAWKANTSLVQIPACKVDGIPLSAFRSRTWYEVPYHNALLLLHRPSPMFPIVPSLSSPTTPGTAQKTSDEPLLSAISAIKLYAELHRTRCLNYSWITLHAVFIAGLSYVHSISRVIKESTSLPRPLPPCLEYTQVIDITRSCSSVLVAINERWAAARDSCEIFDHLSTAIIQDSVKAQLKVDQRRDEHLRPYSPPAPIGGQSASLPQSNVYQAQPPTNREDRNPALAALQDKPCPLDSIQSPSLSLMFADPLPVSAAEAGFRQFSQDLHNRMYRDFPSLSTIPSEVAMGFSQDWYADGMGTLDPFVSRDSFY